MRRFGFLPLVALAGISFGFGCSSSSSSGGSTNVDPATACSDALSAICEKLASCAPLEVDLGYGSVNQCKQRIGYDCPGIFSLNGTKTTPAYYEGCSKALPSLDCAAILQDLPSALQTVPACVSIPGTLANGSACGDAGQCSSTFCAVDDSTGCGTCAAQPAVNDPCVNGQCGHGTGLVCAGTKCVKPVAAGGACDPSGSQPCVQNTTCVGQGTTGICTKDGSLGDQCQLGASDQFAGCDITKSLLCQLSTTSVGTCQTVVEAKPGDTCTVINAVKICTGGSTCGKGDQDYGKVGGGTCLAPAADGGACDNVNGPSCVAPAKCLSGVCKLVDPASCK